VWPVFLRFYHSFSGFSQTRAFERGIHHGVSDEKEADLARSSVENNKVFGHPTK
jgi:hypothetical protein